MKKLVLFIHGLGGSGDTWGKFPELIEADGDIDGGVYEFITYEYGTSLVDPKAALSIVGSIGRLFGIPHAGAVATGLSFLFEDLHNINEIARLLHTQIESTYSGYEDISIIAHSMGGLIAQKYIVDRLNAHEPLKVKKLILYDVPNHGSSLAKIAKFYNHKQLAQLDKNSEFITELNRRSEFQKIPDVVETKYIVCFRGSVVDTISATAGYRDALELDRTHTEIVKPKDRNDEVYIVWKNFILGEDIVEKLFQNLSKPNAVPQMVITKDGVNRYQYLCRIQDKAEEYYRVIYHIALPQSNLTEDEYFQEIGECFKIKSKKQNRIKRDIIDLVKISDKTIFVLITNFENDKHLDDFAKFMRSILDVVGRKLRVITIGGEKLESLKTNMGINSYFNYFNRVFISK